jgi:hypothetical protein
MASGKINGSVTNLSSVFSFYADWSAVSNIAGNYSDVTVKIYIKTSNTAYDFDTVGVRNHSITIDGTTSSVAKQIDCNPWSINPYLIHQYTKRVYHDSDGKKSITISARSNGLASSYGYSNSAGSSGDATLSGTAVLDNIARQATLVTAPNFGDGSNPTITYSNPAGESVTSLQAGIYDSTGYTAYVGYREISKTGTSYTFQLTEAENDALLAACQDSTSVGVRFYLKTTMGGNTYLSPPLDRTFTVNYSDPLITASVVDTNATTIALTGNSGKLIQYFSNAKATMSAEARKGATIDENLYIIRNGDKSGYGTTHTFNNVESNVFTFSAEDSRGKVGTAKVTLPMVAYTKLTCNISDNRPDGDGDMLVSCTGNFFNGSFGAVSNTLTVQYRYKVSGGSWGAWKNMTVSKSGNYYYASAQETGLDYRQTYVFEAKATDKLDEVTRQGSAVKSLPMFHWGENDFVFEVPVTFNAGASGMTVSEQGTWTPSLNASVVSSYTTQSGWYTKTGRVVTVGFYLKATCLSGYAGLGIAISGLPFIPSMSVAGGGMCSGAYVSAGFNFQCFVAESSGNITTRVQACNNTSSANLATSASGCFYPSGSGELTLSGTITYFTNA